MKASRSPGFINVDLEVLSRVRLDPLERALEGTAHALYSGPLRGGVFLLALECNAFPRDADVAIVRLCTAIESLPEAQRRTWDTALSRRFDVGFRLLRGSASEHIALKEKTLRRLVGVGATVAFTCYRDTEGDSLAPQTA